MSQIGFISLNLEVKHMNNEWINKMGREEYTDGQFKYV